MCEVIHFAKSIRLCQQLYPYIDLMHKLITNISLYKTPLFGCNPMEKEYRVLAKVVKYQSQSGNKCLRFEEGDEIDLLTSDLESKLCPSVYQALFRFHITSGYLSQYQEVKQCYIPCKLPGDTLVIEIYCKELNEIGECDTAIDHECVPAEESQGLDFLV